MKSANDNFRCKHLHGSLTIKNCVLRHRRAQLQEVYYMCKECPIGVLHDFNHGHEVVKVQKVIRESGRLENPAYLEMDMEMYNKIDGPLFNKRTLNVEG